MMKISITGTENNNIKFHKDDHELWSSIIFLKYDYRHDAIMMAIVTIVISDTAADRRKNSNNSQKLTRSENISNY